VGQLFKHAAWYVSAGCGAGLFAAIWFVPPPESHTTIADPHVLRIITDEKCQRLPVYQTVVNGTVTRTNAVRPHAGRIPAIRVDFKLDGRPVTLWVWDCPTPGDG